MAFFSYLDLGSTDQFTEIDQIKFLFRQHQGHGNLDLGEKHCVLCGVDHGTQRSKHIVC